MDICGPTLKDLFAFCDDKWSMQTVLKIAIDMISRIEVLHTHGYLHRDIKPENFLIGAGKKSSQIYMIDFGLSKRYRCPKTGEHIKPGQKYGTVGTPRYQSLGSFTQWESSRRDDLEAIGNLLIYFAKGGWLPWMDHEDKSMKK